MQVPRKFVVSLLLLAFLFTEACTKKKPPLPPQAQAPIIAQTLPQEIPEEKEPPTPAPRPVATDTPQPNKKTQKKPAKLTTKKTTPSAATAVAATPPPTPPPAQTPPGQSSQTVASVREPTPELTVAAAIPSDKANKQREDTARMVDTTENTLKGLTRQLTDEEKGMRTQIETYLQQSRKATSDGDYERAFNLAKKAQVLAEALNKQ
jgi:outer membrane biosynthesis protein TonB